MTNDEHGGKLKRHIYALYILNTIVVCLCLVLLYQTKQNKQKFVTRQLVTETIKASQSISIEGEETQVLLSNYPSIVMSRSYPLNSTEGEFEMNNASIDMRIGESALAQGSQITMSGNRTMNPGEPDKGSLRLRCTGNFIGLDLQARGTDQWGDGTVTEPLYFGIAGGSRGETVPRYSPVYHLPDFDTPRNTSYPPFENTSH